MVRLSDQKSRAIPGVSKRGNLIKRIGCLGNGRPEKANMESRKEFQRLATIGSCSHLKPRGTLGNVVPYNQSRVLDSDESKVGTDCTSQNIKFCIMQNVTKSPWN